MLADLAIKIVEKIFDRAMEERDKENIEIYEHKKLLTHRARLTNSDELVISWIERNAPLSFDSLIAAFSDMDCLPKRVAMLCAYGFCETNNGIISITEKYKPLATEISTNSMDQTIIILPKE